MDLLLWSINECSQLNRKWIRNRCKTRARWTLARRKTPWTTTIDRRRRHKIFCRAWTRFPPEACRRIRPTEHLRSRAASAPPVLLEAPIDG